MCRTGWSRVGSLPIEIPAAGEMRGAGVPSYRNSSRGLHIGIRQRADSEAPAAALQEAARA